MIKAEGGYTITEVLIFLAVSGALFTMAMIGTRSQQDSVAFRQASDLIVLKVKEVFNNVDNGYFGNSGQYQCDSSSPDLTNPWVTSGSGGGGNSFNCVFIGKVLEFGTNELTIKTIIGKADSHTNPTNDYRIPDILTETYKYQNTLEMTKSYVYNESTGSGTNINPASNLIVGAARSNDLTSWDSDLRAARYIYNNGTWPNTYQSSDLINNDSQVPVYCFYFNDRYQAVTINQRDVVVDYTGGKCAEL